MPLTSRLALTSARMIIHGRLMLRHTIGRAFEVRREMPVLVDPLPTRSSNERAASQPRFGTQTRARAKKNNKNIADNIRASDTAARSAHAVEVMRREQQTSWEQLRLNARQRETILERCGELLKTYQKFMSRLRGWERLRLREPVQDQPPLQTIEMVRSELESAESELSRQTMRDERWRAK